MTNDKNEKWKKYKQDIIAKLDYQDVYGDIKNQKEGAHGWVSGLCPFHSDKHNSFSFNKRTLTFKCFSECGHGDAFSYLMKKTGKSFRDIIYELGNRLQIQMPFQNQEERPPISDELIKKYKECLKYEESAMNYLKVDRGLTNETIEKYRIGWDIKKERLTIPVWDEKGEPVNIRLYGIKKEPKILNYTEGKWKYGSPARLYGIDELLNYSGKQVVICEGEWDRLLLEQNGLKSVTSTHGCGVFRPEWVKHFEGRDVVLIYDTDETGRSAAINVVLKAFRNSGISSFRNVVIPLSGNPDDKDVSDFFVKRKFTAADLQKLIDETPIHEYKEEKPEEEVIRLGSFTEIEEARYLDKKIECEITVCGETSVAFHSVETFKVNFCLKIRKGECFDCIDAITIPRNAQEYIGSCMSTNVQLIAMLRTYCCQYGQSPSIKILNRTTIKEFFCHQKVNRITQTSDEEGNIIQYIDGRQQELFERRVYYLSHENVKPGNYLATGYVKTHPKTQQVTFLIETLITQEDDYQSFNLEKNIANLQAFQKLSLEDIVEDLNENVTRVYKRDEILLAVLLTYCSPLWIRFNGEIIRGWLLTTIIGDSGSGKSQTHIRFAEFANIGDCFSGLTGSRTGLAYALVEHQQKGWQVKIGRYPANSRKILAVDETQHLPDWDLRVLSKSMDEGFLQIDKVASRGYESMTRLILICNPKKDMIMDTFSFGCASLKSLYPPTIIRRIDFAVFANSGDIQGLSYINKKAEMHKPGKISSEMLRAVIYWVWNLRPDQVVFEPEAENVCMEKATELSEKYGYAVDVPLVPPSDFRNILARISTAFAAVLLSTDEKFSMLIVRDEHVKRAVNFLVAVYSHTNCGLDEYSEIQRLNSQLTDYDDIEKAFLEKRENEKFDYQTGGNFTKTINIFRISDCVRRDDLAEQVECAIDPIKKTVKLLKRYNLIDTTKNGYVKKPKFTKFLRRFFQEHPDFAVQGD